MSILINLFTILVFLFLSLDSFFYFGFTQKHFLINTQYFLTFYLIFGLILSFFKKFSIYQKLFKLNNILFPIFLVISIIFFNLEKNTYPNFIYGHIHINPINFLYLPFISGCIFYFSHQQLFKKTIFFIITPLIATYLSQCLSFNKIIQFNDFFNLKTTIINYILWLNILLLFTSIFRKKHYSLISFLSFFSIVSIINHYKIKLLNNFFIISDLKLIRELKEFIIPLIKGTDLKKELIIIVAIFLLLFLFLKKKFQTKNPSFKIRFRLFIISGFVMIFPIMFPSQFKQILQKYKIETFIPNPLENCRVNGILFCFYDDFKNINNPPPKNYNRVQINQIYSNLKLNKYDKFDKLSTNKPNIIIILSESFWDVTNLPNVKYSEDPIKNIRQDIKSNFKSPSYGGGTANVEFELLTGLSNYFLNGASPYSQVIRKPLPTLFTLFKDENYLTTTIHPFFSSMYNRKNVYKKFGLDNFTSIENMSNYENAGPYVSDKYFNKEILKQLNSTNQPQLIFAISMQNHVIFNANRYSQHPITFQSSLNSDEQAILQSYVDGLNLTDKSYVFLKQELSKNSKPTIVFFFGDHLTFLGTGLDIYQKTGLNITSENKMHTTPLAVWSNYQTDTNLPQNISPSFLSLEILKAANVTPKYQFAFLKSINSSDTVLNQKIPTKLTSDQLKNYELIEYDLLFGKQYGVKFEL
ncbi:MAG: sulfatase-like hydrolase/transferase [Candidatus Shapirobacteria bacterium]|jgi:hypothetical protein